MAQHPWLGPKRPRFESGRSHHSRGCSVTVARGSPEPQVGVQFSAFPTTAPSFNGRTSGLHPDDGGSTPPGATTPHGVKDSTRAFEAHSRGSIPREAAIYIFNVRRRLIHHNSKYFLNFLYFW